MHELYRGGLGGTTNTPWLLFALEWHTLNAEHGNTSAHVSDTQTSAAVMPHTYTNKNTLTRAHAAKPCLHYPHTNRLPCPVLQVQRTDIPPAAWAKTPYLTLPVQAAPRTLSYLVWICHNGCHCLGHSGRQPKLPGSQLLSHRMARPLPNGCKHKGKSGVGMGSEADTHAAASVEV